MVKHLLLLINDILNMSKIESGHTELSETTFNLVTLLHDIHDMFSLRAHTKGLTLQLNLAPDVPSLVEGDERKMRQIVINLISNAIKFTHKGGVTVTVSTASQDMLPTTINDHEADVVLHISVQDSGIGIAPEHREHIFTPFSQIPNTNQNHEGTGLGLPISQQFALLMGGDITVTSTPGEGSIFEVLLPLRYAMYDTKYGYNNRYEAYDIYVVPTQRPASPNNSKKPAMPPGSTADAPCARTPLQHMPVEWLETLRRAARVGNIKLMQDMTHEIAPHHPECSAYLLSLVDAFQFVDIEHIVEQSLSTNDQEGL